MHAVNVLGAGFFAHEDDRLPGLRHFFGFIGVKYDFANGSTGRRWQANGDQVTHCTWRDCWVQQLIQRCRIDPHDRFILGDQAFGDHVDSNLQCSLGGALAVTGLQHPQFAALHRELNVLHIAVMAFELAINLDQL